MVKAGITSRTELDEACVKLPGTINQRLSILAREIYSKLQWFEPTSADKDSKSYHNIAMIASSDGAQAEPWSVFMGRRSLSVQSESGLFFEYLPGRAELQKYGGEGEEHEAEAAVAFTRLNEALARLIDKSATFNLADVHQWHVAQNKVVRIPAKALGSHSFEELAATAYKIKKRCEKTEAIQEISEDKFIAAVAKAVRARFPERTLLTGAERTWEELEAHKGIEHSLFHEKYRGERTGLIDLRKVEERRVDHGTDPIRNYFCISLAEEHGKFRFFVSPHNKDQVERFTEEQIGKSEHIVVLGRRLDIYKALLDAGLPMVLTDYNEADMKGEFNVNVRAADLKAEQLPQVNNYRIAGLRQQNDKPPFMPFDAYFVEDTGI